MPETETRSLMLQTAVAALRETGLTVSLEHISMEDVIREAGVSRTAVYRCWPHKDQFIGDLILELAKTAIPIANTRSPEATTQFKDMFLHRLDDLHSPEARWRLATELVVTASSLDFQHTASLSAQWRTYFALVTTVMNLSDEELLASARQAIGASERQYRDRLSRNFGIIAEILGFRLVDPKHVPLAAVADLVIALIRGLILRNQTAEPETETNEHVSLPALGLTGILMRCFEIDPTVAWDAARADHLRKMLSESDDFFSLSNDGE